MWDGHGRKSEKRGVAQGGVKDDADTRPERDLERSRRNRDVPSARLPVGALAAAGSIPGSPVQPPKHRPPRPPGAHPLGATAPSVMRARLAMTQLAFTGDRRVHQIVLPVARLDRGADSQQVDRNAGRTNLGSSSLRSRDSSGPGMYRHMVGA